MKWSLAKKWKNRNLKWVQFLSNDHLNLHCQFSQKALRIQLTSTKARVDTEKQSCCAAIYGFRFVFPLETGIVSCLTLSGICWNLLYIKWVKNRFPQLTTLTMFSSAAILLPWMVDGLPLLYRPRTVARRAIRMYMPFSACLKYAARGSVSTSTL